MTASLLPGLTSQLLMSLLAHMTNFSWPFFSRLLLEMSLRGLLGLSVSNCLRIRAWSLF
jgi:hypothetical protein